MANCGPDLLFLIIALQALRVDGARVWVWGFGRDVGGGLSGWLVVLKDVTWVDSP